MKEKLAQQHLSPFQMALRRLKKNRLAMAGLFILACLDLPSIFPDYISHYQNENDESARSYNPLTKLHFFDAQGKFHLRPFVYDYTYKFDEFYRRIYTVDKNKMYPL